MIILDATTKKLQILTDATATTTEPSWVTSYAEIVQSTQSLLSCGSSDGATTGTTAVDIVAAPSSGDYRVIKSLHIFNNDTVNRTITVRYNDNGTNRVIQVSTLTPNSALVYEDGAGWYNGKAPFLPLAGGAMTGTLVMPNGLSTAPSLQFDTNAGLYYDATNLGVSLTPNGGSSFLRLTAAGLTMTNTGTFSAIVCSGDNSAFLNFRTYSTSANASNSLQRSRGTIASPSVPVTNDVIGDFLYAVNNSATSTANFGASIRLRGILTETSTVDSTHMGGQLKFDMCPIGSGTLTNVATIDNESGLQMFGSNVVIDKNRNHIGGTMASASQKTVPTTGFSTTISDNVGALIMKPAGTLATGTVTMPANPINNHEVVIASTQIITALTLSPNTGQSINNAVSTLTAGGSARYKYILADTAWYKVG